MRKIRKSMFETNSSSTHALYICKDNKLEEPESLRFDLYAEFGWSFNTYNDQDSKFTYLGIAAIEATEEELEFYMVNLIEALNAIGYREIYDPKEEFKVGDEVVPTRLVNYTGTHLKQYDKSYTISEIKGDRVVLMARGQVWAAMNIKDIKHC